MPPPPDSTSFSPLYSGPTESSLRLIGRPVTSINQCHKKGAKHTLAPFSPPKKEYVVREAIFFDSLKSQKSPYVPSGMQCCILNWTAP